MQPMYYIGLDVHISNNVGPVKHFLSRHIHRLRRVFSLSLSSVLSDWAWASSVRS
jgi:hypothetical protein